MKQKLKKIGRDLLVGGALVYSLLTTSGCEGWNDPVGLPKSCDPQEWAETEHLPAFEEARARRCPSYERTPPCYDHAPETEPCTTNKPVQSNTNLEDYIAGTFGSAESREIAGRDYRIIDVTGNGAFFVDAINYSKFIDKLRQLDTHLQRQDGHGIRNSNELAGIVNLMAIDDEIVSQAEIQNLDKPDQFGALLYDVRDTVYHYHN